MKAATSLGLGMRAFGISPWSVQVPAGWVVTAKITTPTREVSMRAMPQGAPP